MPIYRNKDGRPASEIDWERQKIIVGAYHDLLETLPEDVRSAFEDLSAIVAGEFMDSGVLTLPETASFAADAVIAAMLASESGAYIKEWLFGHSRKELQ